MEKLDKKKFIEVFQVRQKHRIAVLGDLMLDHFLYGCVHKINPEAVAPLMTYQSEKFQLGGAGFVANILAQLDCYVDIISVVGQDSNAEKIKNLLGENSIETKFLIEDESRPTICKQRIESSNNNYRSFNQQLLRIDYEKTHCLNEDIEKEVLRFIDLNYKDYSVIIVSDYGKGFITENILQKLRSLRSEVLLIADPKKSTVSDWYRGFHFVKPNRYEAQQLLNQGLQEKETIEKLGTKLHKMMGVDNLIISLDNDGLFFCSKDEQGFVPTKKQEIFDVSGAGDAIIAVLAFLFPFNNLLLKEKLYIANAAARVIIRQTGEKFLNRSLLLAESLFLNERKNRKFSTITEVKDKLNNITDKKIIFTNGYFNKIGFKQIEFLKKFSLLDGVKILALNSDSSLAKHKHDSCLKEADRAQLLYLFSSIDYVVLFDNLNCEEILLELKPDIFVKGSNYKEETIQELPIIKSLGIELKFI